MQAVLASDTVPLIRECESVDNACTSNILCIHFIAFIETASLLYLL